MPSRRPGPGQAARAVALPTARRLCYQRAVRIDAGSFDRWTGPDRLPWLVLAIATLLVFFVGVGDRQMHGTAAFYASMSWQIAETGIWLPLHNGPEPYWLKPPLVFWLSALTMEGLGPTNLAASLWSRLFGVGCVALTALLARRFYGATAGVLAGVICLTNGTLIETAITFRLDTALLFWMLLALLAAWGACEDPPEPCPADVNGDGAVDVTDLLILLANWG